LYDKVWPIIEFEALGNDDRVFGLICDGRFAVNNQFVIRKIDCADQTPRIIATDNMSVSKALRAAPDKADRFWIRYVGEE
jgi:hypothetical protein